MKITNVRYSLRSLLMAMAAASVLFGGLLVSPYGFNAQTEVTTLSGPTFSTMVQWHYRYDAYGIRATKLDYVVIIIRPERTGTSVGEHDGAPTVYFGDRTVELSNNTQLCEVEDGRVTEFKERITYSQWLAFRARYVGPFRVKDLLRSVGK